MEGKDESECEEGKGKRKAGKSQPTMVIEGEGAGKWEKKEAFKDQDVGAFRRHARKETRTQCPVASKPPRPGDTSAPWTGVSSVLPGAFFRKREG